MGTFRAEERNVPGGEERGETDVFAGYTKPRASFATSNGHLQGSPHLKIWLNRSCATGLKNENEPHANSRAQTEHILTYSDMSKICTGQSTCRVSRFMANYHHSFKSWQSAVSNLMLKLQLHFSGSLRSEFQDKRLFVYLLSAEIFFRPRPTNQTFSVFVSKVQNEQGILSFVHRKLSWES